MLDIQFLAASLFSISYLYFEKKNRAEKHEPQQKKLASFSTLALCPVPSKSQPQSVSPVLMSAMVCIVALFGLTTIWSSGEALLWRS